MTLVHASQDPEEKEFAHNTDQIDEVKRPPRVTKKRTKRQSTQRPRFTINSTSTNDAEELKIRFKPIQGQDPEDNDNTVALNGDDDEAKIITIADNEELEGQEESGRHKRKVEPISSPFDVEEDDIHIKNNVATRDSVAMINTLMKKKRLRVEETNFTKLPGWPGDFSRDMNPHKYINDLEIFCAINHLSEDEMIDGLLLANIGNSTITNMILEARLRDAQFLAIKSKFLQITAPFGLHSLRREYESLKQDGSIHDYVEKFQDLVSILKLRDDDPQVGAHFTSHLNDYYKDAVDRSRSQYQLAFKEDITSLSELMHLALQVPSTSANLNATIVRCQFCRSKYHTIDNCPVKGMIRCDICGRSNHSTAHCRFRRSGRRPTFYRTFDASARYNNFNNNYDNNHNNSFSNNYNNNNSGNNNYNSNNNNQRMLANNNNHNMMNNNYNNSNNNNLNNNYRMLTDNNNNYHQGRPVMKYNNYYRNNSMKFRNGNNRRYYSPKNITHSSNTNDSIKKLGSMHNDLITNLILCNKKVTALIDSGSTLNLIKPTVVTKYQLPITMTEVKAKTIDPHHSILLTQKVHCLLGTNNNIQTTADFYIFDFGDEHIDILLSNSTAVELQLIFSTNYRTPPSIETLSQLEMVSPNDTLDELEANSTACDSNNNNSYSDVFNNSPAVTETIQDKRVSDNEQIRIEIQQELEKNNRLDNGFCILDEAVVEYQLKDSTPIYVPQYPIPQALQPVVRKKIDEWLTSGKIKSADVTPHNLPITVVPKRNKEGHIIGTRICLDQRQLNKQLVKLSFPMPNINTLLQKFRGAQYISELDLSEAYLQLRVAESAQKLLTFTFDDRQYSFVGAPYGGVHLSSWFQRVIKRYFTENFVLVYLDNIIVISKNLQEHIAHLLLVIQKLNEAHLKLNTAKCQFGFKSIRLLGHLISADKLQVDPLKVEAINRIEFPTSYKEVKRLTGLVNYLRNYIPNCASLTVHFDRISSPQVFKKLTSTQKEELMKQLTLLKQKVQESISLSYPDLTRPFFIETDASDTAIAAVLYQKNNNNSDNSTSDNSRQIVSVISRVLKQYELRYTVHKKELLAIVYALSKFRSIIWGTPHSIQILTDNMALSHYINSSSGRTENTWLSYIDDFDIQFHHIRGEKNCLADSLSRTYRIAVEINPAQKVQLIEEAHAKGHYGVAAVLYDLKRNGIEWIGILKDIKIVLKNCLLCLNFKKVNMTFDKLTPTISEFPWQHIQMDIILGLPVNDGYRMILATICTFTGFIVLVPLKDKSSNTITNALLQIFSLFGTPETVRSDNAKEFTSSLLAQILHYLGIQQQTAVPYASRQKGIIERTIRSIMQSLRIELQGNQRWLEHIPRVQFLHNIRVSSTTNVDPFLLMFGRCVNETSDINGIPWRDRWNTVLSRLYPKIRNDIMINRTKYNQRFMDRHTIENKRLIPGTKVMVKNIAPLNRLDRQFFGPFIIEKIFSNGYQLSGIQRLFTRDQLKVIR